jgi:hypothetical protein
MPGVAAQAQRVAWGCNLPPPAYIYLSGYLRAGGTPFRIPAFTRSDSFPPGATH